MIRRRYWVAAGHAALHAVAVLCCASVTSVSCSRTVGYASDGDDDGDGRGGAIVIPQCHVESVDPPMGASGVDVFRPKLQIRYSEPIDSSSFTGQVRLIDLSDQSTVPTEATFLDPQTVELSPSATLHYWASYALEIGDGVITARGDSCLSQASVFDTFEPTAQLIEQLRPSPVQAIAIMDNFGIVVSNQLNGLEVYDLTDVAQPVLLSRTLIEGEPLAVQILDARAYVSVGSGGVWIFDLSDPAAPELLGIAGTPGGAIDVAPFQDSVGDHYLAVADGELGLRILKVQNPSAETTVFTHYFGPFRSASRVSIDGNILAVGIGGYGFALFDVTTPSGPALITQRGSEPIPESSMSTRPISDVLVVGDRLYVALGTLGAQSFLIGSNSATYLGFAAGPQVNCLQNCHDQIDNLAFSAGPPGGPGMLFATGLITGGLRAEPDSSGQMGPMTSLPVAANARALAVHDDFVVIGADSGLEIRGRSAGPDDPPIYSEQASWGILRALTGRSGYLYGASAGRGVVTIDSSTLEIVDVDATRGVSTDYGAFDIALEGSTLVLGDARGGFSSFDVSRANNPKLVFEPSGDFDLVNGTIIKNGRLYLCDGNRAVRIYSVSPDSGVASLGSLFVNDDLGNCQDLALVESQGKNILYVAGGKGLGVVDATDPGAMSLIAAKQLPSGEILSSVFRVGDYLYVTASNQDFEAGTDTRDRKIAIFDIADALDPKLVFTTPDLGVGGSLALVNDKLFVPALWNQVLVFDVSAPEAPLLEGSIPVPGAPAGLYADGNTLFAACRGAGVVPIVVGISE